MQGVLENIAEPEAAEAEPEPADTVEPAPLDAAPLEATAASPEPTPAAPEPAAAPAPKKRGRPPKAQVEAPPPAPKARPAPKPKAVRKPKPPVEDSSDSSDVDTTLRNVYNHVQKPDMESAILQFLVNRKQAESTRRRELWGRLAQF